MPQARTSGLPAEEAPLLASISAALARRRKAIRHRTSALTVLRTVEEHDGVSLQRLDVSLEASGRAGPRVRLSVWADGAALVDVRQLGARGWRFEHTVEASVASALGRDIVHRLEQTLRLAFSASRGADIGPELGMLWQAALQR